MVWLRRLALVVSIVVCSSLAFATASAASGTQAASPQLRAAGGKGGGPLPAGNYQFNSTRADYSFFLDASHPQITIFVTHTVSIAHPRGGPSTTTDETDVLVQISNSTVDGTGCYILGKPSDFTISNDLQTASLHTTLTDAMPMCGLPPTGLASSFTIDATWTGIGVAAPTSDTNHYRCLTYRTESTTAAADDPATASATLSLFPGTFPTSQAGTHSSRNHVEVEGAVQPTCLFIV